jgi:hypothetical protein
MCIHNVLSAERWIDHYGDVVVESSFGNKARISFIQVRFKKKRIFQSEKSFLE